MGNEIDIKEAMIFLQELKDCLCNIEQILKDIENRKIWNRKINGLNQVIYLLKKKEKDGKHEVMWKEFKWKYGDYPMEEDIDIATQMNNFEQKHFPKDKSIGAL